VTAGKGSLSTGSISYRRTHLATRSDNVRQAIDLETSECAAIIRCPDYSNIAACPVEERKANPLAVGSAARKESAMLRRNLDIAPALAQKKLNTAKEERHGNSEQ
jgi:hypothetical protein